MCKRSEPLRALGGRLELGGPLPHILLAHRRVVVAQYVLRLRLAAAVQPRVVDLLRLAEFKNGS